VEGVGLEKGKAPHLGVLAVVVAVEATPVRRAYLGKEAMVERVRTLLSSLSVVVVAVKTLTETLPVTAVRVLRPLSQVLVLLGQGVVVVAH
jgi:hypothetical protein